MVERYLKAGSLVEAMQFLNHYEGRARVVAGATDLWVGIKNHNTKAEAFVDITGVDELKTVEISKDYIRIGSGVTFHELEKNVQIQKNLRALQEAARWMGSPQIRRMATLGGNLVSAQPAADGMVAMSALDVAVEMVGPDGTKRRTLESCYKTFGESMIDSSREIVTAFVIPLHNQAHSYFGRFHLREANALPVINCAVGAWMKEDGSWESRYILAPLGYHPARLRAMEDALAGGLLEERELYDTIEKHIEELTFRTSLVRGSAEFRKQIAVQLMHEQIIRLWYNHEQEGESDAKH